MRFWTVCLLLSAVGVAVAAQPASRQHVILALNPVKAVLGLLNFELEYALLPHFSTALSGEYLLSDRTITQDEQPDLLVRSELRYFLLGSSCGAGLYAGVNAGYAHSAVAVDGPFVGLGAGYRVPLAVRFFVAPRGLLSYSIAHARVIPGFELLAGIVF